MKTDSACGEKRDARSETTYFVEIVLARLCKSLVMIEE